MPTNFTHHQRMTPLNALETERNHSNLQEDWQNL